MPVQLPKKVVEPSKTIDEGEFVIAILSGQKAHACHCGELMVAPPSQSGKPVQGSAMCKCGLRWMVYGVETLHWYYLKNGRSWERD